MTELAKKWLTKYYPETAQEAAKKGEYEALRHSHRKWVGLQPSILNMYGLGMDYRTVVEDSNGDTVIFLDSDSCALCMRHNRGNDCGSCSLNGCSGQFCTMTGTGNPKPMIQLLLGARKVARQIDRDAKK